MQWLYEIHKDYYEIFDSFAIYNYWLPSHLSNVKQEHWSHVKLYLKHVYMEVCMYVFLNGLKKNYALENHYFTCH